MLQFELDFFIKRSVGEDKKEINTKIYHARYTWHDKDYRDYMRNIIAVLEPRVEEAGTVLVKELDEFDEVIFFIQG